MLKQLQISNYALIQELNLEPARGLTVITGETGAGKSILLGALGLILGQRADTRVLRDQKNKCVVEGLFELSDDARAMEVIRHYQLDADPQTVLRREISPSGKSRAFVNDTPVSLNIMKEIGEKLIDIHAQHQNLLIGTSPFQFYVLDSAAGILADVDNFQQHYRQWQHALNELKRLREESQRAASEADYMHFQLNEMLFLREDASYYQSLEQELRLLRHAGEISGHLSAALTRLEQEPADLLGGLYDTVCELQAAGRYQEELSLLADRLESARIEIKDIASDLHRQSRQMMPDPQRLAELEGLWDQINRLLLKHRKNKIEDLFAIRDELNQKLGISEDLDQKIHALEKTLSLTESNLRDASARLSALRKAAVSDIEAQISQMLIRLGMPSARFAIVIEHTDSIQFNGSDRLSFQFSANKGMPMADIASVASGGELSRLMLAVKSLVSQKSLLPTIIFDEIDTGISGETASQTARILETMARDMQVMAITHLPQLAACGSHHLKVIKEENDNTTHTRLIRLDYEERMAEVARMLGGDHPSEAMKRTARELMQRSLKEIH